MKGAALSDADIEELATYRGAGMISAVGEYTPPEFWQLLDEVKQRRAADRRLTAEQGGASLTEQLISDLLDAYKDEVSCERYNGWHRYRSSEDIRKELNELIARLAAPCAALTTQPQAEPTVHLPCGHPASLMLASAETGEPLYCELCDDKSGRRDAEKREAELSAELAEANETIRQLNRALGEEVNGATFMGEPAPTAPPQAERERINLLLAAIREHWVKSNGEESITVAALDQIAAVIADGSYVGSAPTEPT